MEDAELEVVGVESVGPDTVAIDIASPPEFDAQPGQFVKLTVAVDGEDLSRFYTISSPDVADTFELTVEIDDDGDVGPTVSELEAGDTVSVSGPFGSDYYAGEDPVVVLAGGPGIGPAVAIAERALADGHDAVVIYRDDEPVHQARIASLRDRGATVAVVDSDADLQAAVQDAYTEYPDPALFVYGFADFIDAATTAVTAAGGETAHAKIENFG